MKKFAVFLLFLFFLSFSGCAEKDLIDIYTFSDRFSDMSENFKINNDNFMATEKDGELVFPITFEDKFLLTVRLNEKTSLVTDVSVVYLLENKKSMTETEFNQFYEIADCAVKAFTDFDSADDILSNLSLKEKEKLFKNTHLHYEKGFYTFSLVSNELGLYFSASTERR